MKNISNISIFILLLIFSSSFFSGGRGLTEEGKVNVPSTTLGIPIVLNLCLQLLEGLKHPTQGILFLFTLF